MTDGALLDALAESARNRGLKLVRSRVRTPGKGDYGKVGLTDAAGKPLFGFAGKTLAATPQEAADYLRGLEVGDWRASLGASGVPRKKRKPPPAPVIEEPPLVEAEPEPAPEPEPEPVIREAHGGDAAVLVELIGLLDHEVDAKGVAERIGQLAAMGEGPIVAVLGEEVVGLCGFHQMTVVYRPAPVGRVTILVVAEAMQGSGLGRLLVEHAEAMLREAGCDMIEITSNDQLTRAHAFYRHLGYERTSMRFVRLLDPG